MSDDIVTGQLSESFLKKDITWKIDDFFVIDRPVTSPCFTFANATWCMRMYPNGRKDDATDGCIEFTIDRIRPRDSDSTIFFQFHILSKRKVKYMSAADKIYFNKKWQGMAQIFCSDRPHLVYCQPAIAANGTVTVLLEVSKGNEAWHGFTWKYEKLLQDYKKLLQTGVDTDVIVRVMGEECPVHKGILRVRSSVFEELFKTSWKDKSIVDIDECDPDIFKDFLCFLYVGSVENLSADNVFSLFAVALRYDVQELRSRCLQFIKDNLSLDAFYKMLVFYVKNPDEELKKVANDYFSNHFEGIIDTKEWHEFLLEHPSFANDLVEAARNGTLRISEISLTREIND